ncbi:MAG: pyridoxal phosphate-dependent aminotransferase [Ignavibacteriales bacterium]|nr:MAG: pyridoxal phosphate-dependent aminotransferase [Ignavibacteriales bacterium]
MKVAGKAKELKAQGIDVIDLSLGEPDFPTPQNVKDAAVRGLAEGHTRYTLNPGTMELRKAISTKLKNENGLDYDPSEIIVSSGCKQSIFNAVMATVNEGDEVIIPAPYWVSYPDMVSLSGGVCVFPQTKEENGFRITAEELEAVITPKTRMLILCNPSNPTGGSFDEKWLKSIADVVKKHNFYVLSDEIYEKLVFDDFKFVSFPAVAPDLKSQIILVNGVSKSYAMTGWRIGYTAGPKEVIQAMDKIQSNSTSGPSAISQYATIEALLGDQSEVEKMRVEFEKRRNYLYDEITKIPGFTCYKPEGAFYLFPGIKSFFGKSFNGKVIKDSMDFSMFLLEEARIAAVAGSPFGSDGYIRFSYATSMAQLEDAVRRIKAAVAKLV